MEIVLILHSYLRWAVLLLAVWVLAKALMGMSNGSPFGEADRKPSLFFMISCDTMLLLGLILYFGNGWSSLLTAEGTMKEAGIRYFAVEHLTVMLIALVLVHIGYAKVKRGIGQVATHKTALIFYGIALLLMLSRIPFADRPMFRF
jgi:hypothetical protein